MPPIRSLSVLIPTWQGTAYLDRALSALAAQEIAIPWDVLAVDSSSTDGTWELLGERAASFPVPFRRRRIHPVEFDHGDTRNLLAALSGGELLVFLTQDAIPASRDFLARLAANFDDPRVAAACARNAPRPDAELLTKLASQHDPGYATERREVRLPPADEYGHMDAHARRLLFNFNDVASAVRRSVWERHPFPRTSFGEDVLMARALVEAGFTVVYDSGAVVEHSHDYDAAETRRRCEIDGRFNAEWLDRVCVGSRSDARELARRQLVRDEEALRASGLAGAALDAELARARELREAAFEGLWSGGRTTRRRPASRLLERSKLSILYVVHGFPPDTWAGTEVYTLNLAREMQRRGHRVTVLTRAPATRSVGEGGPPDFAVEEGTFEDLRVLRMTHRLEHESIRASYSQPRAEAAFRRVLLAERPDLVHFQHLIHTSVGLVHVARELGLPTVLHCHDYWALCARVQLVRPDGVRCEENMGSGCFLCVKETALEHVPRMKRLDRVAGRALDAVAAGLGRTGKKGARRWEGFADLRARQDVVLDAYAAADLRVSPSRFLRGKLLASGAFEPETFLYSDNGMRTDHVEALAKRPDPAGRVRFGFVGSLVWYKGGEVMLRAMERLAGRKAVLNVYGAFDPGKDPHHAALRDTAPPNVVFKGRFDNARLSQVYAEIDVLLVPSVWFENSPITIHEAYLTHTPVVASDIGGMAEYVRDGVDGLLFRVGDAEDLARKLARFLDEPDLVERLSRDWMEIKTIEEDAAATEFRYRALCAIVREPVASRAGARASGPLLELGARDTAARGGPVEEQGDRYLLLRPGGFVEYDLARAGGGPRELVLEQLALGAEPGLDLGGRVLVDGVEVARLGPERSGGRDRVLRAALALDLAAAARRLRVEADGAHLRLASVRVSAAAPAEVGS